MALGELTVCAASTPTGKIWMSIFLYHALLSCTPSQSIGLFFGVCAFLVLSVFMCSFYLFLYGVLFHRDGSDYYSDFYGHSIHFELHIWAFCN